MVNLLELLLIGSFAGFTIFLGLPVVLMGISDRIRGFLNAFAVGILTFLIVDVFSHAWDTTTGAAVAAYQGTGSVGDAVVYLLLMFAGITVGLLGLVVYERRYMGKGWEGAAPAKLSIMTAFGIGAHNLSEGLAIGQSFAAGLVGLGVVLAVGFAAHNTTEGFGITAPLVGMETRQRVSFLA